MRFDTSQHMKMSQQMKLAPRMIQSMEILQLNQMALEERIEQELESNIALETYEGTPDRQELDEARREREREARENERPLTVDENGGPDDFERLDAMESNYSEAFENEYSAASAARTFEYEPQYRASRFEGERDAKLDAMANTAAPSGSLADQLLEQWAFADIDEELREPGKLLIGYIDRDGYIKTPLETICDTAPQNNGARVSLETLQRALVAVQFFLEPPGIGARDVPECLLLQIDAIEDTEPGEDWTIARDLIEHHLDDLVHNRIPKIEKKVDYSLDQIKQAIDQMHRLTIWPARQLIDESPPTIVPDAIVEFEEENDRYLGYLTDGRSPNLRVNREYARMMRDRKVPKQDREFIRTNINNAQWLIDAINQRRQTLQRVLNVVVEAQHEVFEQGMQALKPLPMTQVADQLGIHVATVSRAVAGKYVQTPRGVFPLRKFFTGGTQTESGEDMSWEAIKAALQEIVDGEDKARPLSDERLVEELKKRGIDIARRTVAKYRGQLDIPPARMRKQF